MAFIPTRLSECVAYGFSGGPAYLTDVIPMDNGGEQRNQRWLYPRHSYSAEYLNLSVEAQGEILAAFHAARGRLHAFRFKDWNDYEARAEPLAPAVGTSTPVQLIKTYQFGGEATVRLIQAPVSAVIRRSGVVVAGTLELQTGLFTPAAPWAAGVYTWDGEFDVWVRFDSDYNAFAIGAPNARTAEVVLIEVRR